MENYEVIKVGEPVELRMCGDYIAASDGKIYKLNWHNSGKMREVKQTKHPNGYLLFRFNEKLMRSHRFIATCFIPNPNNLPEINHKNEIKTDNWVENLEWCDRKYNINYGTRNEKAGRNLVGKNVGKYINHPDISKPVSQYTKFGDFIAIYPSAREAERQTGVKNSSISQCCHGKLKTAGGYCWRLEEM